MPVLPILTLTLLVTAELATADNGCVASQPCYSAASIANAAANVAGYYAPYSFLSIYGTNLSYVTGSLGPGDIAGGQLPPNGIIQGTEVGVVLNNTPGYVYYVSPTQVNVLIPQILVAGPVTVHRPVYFALQSLSMSSAPTSRRLTHRGDASRWRPALCCKPGLCSGAAQ